MRFVIHCGYTFHQPLYLIIRVSDGGAAFELGGPCRYIFCTQAEVVMGGLHRQGGSGLSSFLDQFQWLCRGQVNDVAPHPGAQEDYSYCNKHN